MCFQSKAPISHSLIQQVVVVSVCLRLAWFSFTLSYFACLSKDLVRTKFVVLNILGIYLPFVYIHMCERDLHIIS